MKAQNRSRSKTGKTESSSRTRLDKVLEEYARLIMQPCHGPLTRTLSPMNTAAVTERVRTSVIVNSTDANGYVVWFPGYHNNAAAGGFSNMFYYTTATSSAGPNNSGALPLGAGGVSGINVSDPSTPNLTSTSAFSRARTSSACLQLEYIGALSAVSGQVATVANFTLEQWNAQSGTPGTFAPISVDRVFEFAAQRERLQFSGHEVVWRPTDAISIFRHNGTAGGGTAGGTASDTVYWNGTVGSAVADQSATDPANVYGLCIAWRGVPAAANTITFNAVKVVDFELSARNNQIESLAPAAISAGTNMVDKAVQLLDDYVPGWQRRAINATINSIGNLAMSYAPSAMIANASSGLRGRQPVPMQPPRLTNGP